MINEGSILVESGSIKLGLGTAQFGLDYGVSNQGGRCSVNEAKLIVEVAKQEGIRVIDTAFLYGDSETTLGKILPENHRFDIVTKTPSFGTACISSTEIDLLEKTFVKSLKNLNQESIYGILIHHVNDVLKKEGRLLLKKLKEFKKRNLVKKIGVSVYTAEQINQILSEHSIDLIQLPVNILDQRLLKSDSLKKLKKLGVEIHARSIFLQGLLLMDPDNLAPCFGSIRGHLKQYHFMLKRHKIKPIQAALDFVRKLQEVDIILCGVNSHVELKEIVSSFQKTTSLDFSSFAISDPMILNPSNWKL